MRAELRDYQVECVVGVRALLRENHSVLLVLPTGGGKTYTYAFIAESAGARGHRVIILEHRKELIRQASLSLGSIGVRHRIIAPPAKIAGIRRAHVKAFGYPMLDQSSHVVVASVQTLGRKLADLTEFDPDLVIIDEAHHAVAGTWAKVLEAVRGKILGVTATPQRQDGRGLADVFEAMHVGPSMLELIELGALVRPLVICPPELADFSAVKRRGKDLDPDSQAEAMNKSHITGCAIDHYERHSPSGRAIVFCVNLAHAETVAQRFRDRGHNFHAVHGGMEDAERDRLIYGLADGSVTGLVSVDLISEGTDIPAADVAILLRKTESEALFLQQCGRVLRPAPGKAYGVILDHVGNCGKFVNGDFVRNHGLPHDDRAWSLLGRKRNDKNQADKPVEARQCPSCYAVHDPLPKCPVCGFVYTVRPDARGTAETSGELVAVPVDPVKLERMQARIAQARAETVEEMVRNGYSAERAAHVLAARADKDALIAELIGALERWQKQNPRLNVFREFKHTIGDVRRMKPKQLKTRIEQMAQIALAQSPA